ncbi:hypothetical protein [Sphingomonas mali]|uniref:hypothetical protein n=1 Tax=Sphingomonas mali TaxID=40682 RepID=UPI000834C2CE|nr:hypothetical protein [Sphingomonas mali]
MKRGRRRYRSWADASPPENAASVQSSPVRLRYSRALLDETKQVWQPYYEAPLSDEDARQIIENMVGFARFLARERQVKPHTRRISSSPDAP